MGHRPRQRGGQEPVEPLPAQREDARVDLAEVRDPDPLAGRMVAEPSPQVDQVLTPIDVAIDQVLRAAVGPPETTLK